MNEENQTQKEEKPEIPDENEQISLRVVSQDGSEVLFRIKKKTPLRRMMDAFCQRMAVSPKAMRFLYEGARISEDQCANDLKMEDKDIIDAVLQQVGGNSFALIK